MSETPNVVIESPAVRRALNAIVGYGSLLVGLVVAVDTASPAFDLLAYTTPTWAGLAFLNSALTVGVTIPNIPAAQTRSTRPTSTDTPPADENNWARPGD